MTNQFLIEFDGHDGSGVITTRLATGNGFKTAKTETPAQTPYLPRIIDTGTIETYLFESAKTTGQSTSGFGRAVLNNADDGLDSVLDLGVDGRAFIVREKIGDAYPTDFPIRFAGIIDFRESTDTTITLSVKTALHKVLKLPYQPVKYLGDNSDALGVEGTPDDLIGKPKPRLRGGIAKNLTPIMVNEAGETYQISSDEVQTIDTVYNGRAPVAAGTGHATLALLVVASPSAATFDFYLGDNTKSIGDNERGCYFRFGTTPSHDVTCDATEGVNVAARSIAQVVDRLLVDKGFSLTSASKTAADADFVHEVQHWQTTIESTVGDIIRDILPSGSFFLTDDPTTGDLTIGRFKIPTVGEVALTVNEKTLINVPKVKKIRSQDQSKNIPVNRVNVLWDENYTIMNRPQLTGVADTIKELAFVNERYRVSSDNDATVLTQFLNSPELDIRTKLVTSTGAGDQDTHALNLYKVLREIIEIIVPTEFAGTIDKNDVIRVRGKIYRVIGKKYSFPSANKRITTAAVTFQAWGGISG